jgi:hypothetical protein
MKGAVQGLAVVAGMRRMVAEFVLLLEFAYRSLGEGRGVPIPLFIVEYMEVAAVSKEEGAFSPREIL